MSDRQQLHFKQKKRMGLLIVLHAFLVFFCLATTATAALELGKNNISDQLDFNLNNEKSVIPGPKTDEVEIETEKIGVVATVNGDSITVLDILEICGWQESKLPYLYQGNRLKEEVEKLRLLTLDKVIDRKLVYQEFKEKGYKLPKKFVEENLDRLMVSFNVNNRRELEKQLKANGLTMEEFRERAYENVAVDLLINDRCYIDVYITPRDVYDYYLKNKSAFASPEQVHLQVLKLKADGVHKDELNTLSKHLKKILKNKSKKEFTDAVLLYSEGPNIEHGGDIGWIDRSKLRKDFLELVKDADSGDVVGPIKSKDGYYFLYVADIRRKKTESFKQTKKSIKEKLTKERKEKDYKTYIDSLYAKAYIKKYL